MPETPGQIFRWLVAASERSGSLRSVYSQDTTLSRRGLLGRAERRARELAAAGVRAHDLVGLSMGNVVEFLVLLLAASKLGATAVPIDPANGDRTLIDASARLPLRAVIRRPRGQDALGPDYPRGYKVRSRKRLSGSLLVFDILEPPKQTFRSDLTDVELILETRAPGGAVRDVLRTGQQLRSIGAAAARCLALDETTRILCAQPFTVPRFFDPVVLGWLSSEAQLVMAEGPALESVLPIARNYERLLVVDSVRQFNELARTLNASGTTLPLRPVIPQATVPVLSGKAIAEAFTHSPIQLLLLEEMGLLGSRVMERDAVFQPVDGVAFKSGEAMKMGGVEVLARSVHAGRSLPLPVAREPGAPVGPVASVAPDGPDAPDAAADAWLHTGYAGKFSRQGALVDVLGRDDGLVNLDGRRACLDSIEEAMLTHKRLTWARAWLEHTADGDPEVLFEYKATGETEVDDIEEHAVGQLPPFMVPREFVRLPE